MILAVPEPSLLGTLLPGGLREELKEALNDILASRALRRKEAETLRGRLGCYISFWESSVPCRECTSSWASGYSRGFTTELESALQVLRTHVTTAKPIQISLNSMRASYIFTDGFL